MAFTNVLEAKSSPNERLAMIAPNRAASLEHLVPQTYRPKPRRRPREPTPNRQTTLAFPSDEAFLPLSLCLSLGPIE